MNRPFDMNVYIIQDKPQHIYLTAGPEIIHCLHHSKRKYLWIFCPQFYHKCLAFQVKEPSEGVVHHLCQELTQFPSLVHAPIGKSTALISKVLRNPLFQPNIYIQLM